MVVTKKTPKALCGKKYTTKVMSAGQKDMDLFLLQLQCVFILLDSLYKLWSL